ncbi:angiopoietin-related protein 5-like [Pelodytes ibericus]
MQTWSSYSLDDEQRIIDSYKLKVFKLIVYMCLCFQCSAVQGDVDINVKEYDCSSIWQENKRSISGIYMVKPMGAAKSFQVFCEMNADGGWTVIQKHDGQDGLCFDRTWEAYKLGFGNIEGEHWLGLDKIYLLTNQPGRTSELLVRIGNFAGAEAFALYSSFAVGPETAFYQLSLGNYSGNAGDAFRGKDNMTNQDGSFFSTKDQDHDNCDPCIMDDIVFLSCSQYVYHSGWWFNGCGIANLNGRWNPYGKHVGVASSISWKTWLRHESSKFSTLSIRHSVKPL